MPRFAANLSMLFGETEFLDRFERAARHGFEGVEYLFPYAYDVAALSQRLTESGLVQALFNMPPGDWGAGERGLAALPGRENEFREGVDRALEYAAALDCPRIHAMAGLVPEGESRDRCAEIYVENMRYAAGKLQETGRDLMVEQINDRDMPGYFLTTTAQAIDLIREIGQPNVKLQLDLYHCQIMEGNLATRIEALFDDIGHIQIAGVPGRHEPDVGEINYPFIFEKLDALGYAGWVGCEYKPKSGTEDGLGWLIQPIAQRVPVD